MDWVKVSFDNMIPNVYNNSEFVEIQDVYAYVEGGYEPSPDSWFIWNDSHNEILGLTAKKIDGEFVVDNSVGYGQSKIVIPLNCTAISEYNAMRTVESDGVIEVLDNNNYLNDCYMYDNVTILQQGCFSNCNNLNKIRLSNNLTSLINSVFSSCISLTEITIPNLITSIQNNAFSYCTNLKTIKIIRNEVSGGRYPYTPLTIQNAFTSGMTIDEIQFNCEESVATRWVYVQPNEPTISIWNNAEKLYNQPITN